MWTVSENFVAHDLRCIPKLSVLISQNNFEILKDVVDDFGLAFSVTKNF